MTYQVENRFQSLPFKYIHNLQRYTEYLTSARVEEAKRWGSARWNQVDP
jgi:hypothetical protein